MKRLLILLSVICYFTTGFPTVYYVTKQGDNGNAGTSKAEAWLTVANAISNVVAGDTVYIYKGLYSENLTLATSGTGGAPICWIAYEDSVIFRAAGGANFNLYCNAKDYNRFYGFYFVGSESNNGTVFVGTGSDGIWFVNCYFIIPHNTRTLNTTIEMSTGSGNKISYCVFYGDAHGTNGMIRMDNNGLENTIIEYNTFNLTRASQFTGDIKVIYVDGDGGGNIIRNNIFYCQDSSQASGTFYCVAGNPADTSAWNNNSNENIFDHNVLFGFDTDYYPSFNTGAGFGDNNITNNPRMIIKDRALNNYVSSDFNPSFKIWGYVKKGSPAINASSDGIDIGAEPFVTIIGY
ncbi:MAG: hypothetical protein KC713_03775 [Candidatus Omnitrophica bacterium]|nr:hypothetical protein [Candidatus Omnitrophota bacterium]